jgi:PDZ domain
MRGISLIACAAALIGSVAPLAAQQPAQPSRPKTPASNDGCVTTAAGQVECRRIIERGIGSRMDSALMKRAALGIQLTATGTARDTLGVFVSAVTPKGPAENAGIIEGDRIVSINGVDLRVAPGDIEDGYASGLPAHRLQREVQKLTPGARVNLRVYANGRVRDVQITAGRASDLMRTSAFSYGFDGPGMTVLRGGEWTPAIPPMPEMAPMPPMPPMPPMARMELAPEMRMRLEALPQMRQMQVLPEMLRQRLQNLPMRLNQLRSIIPSRVIMPRTYRI